MKLTILSVIISLLPLIACDACEPGYYWSTVIGTNNGCHKCFCSGVTDKCQGGSFYSHTVETKARKVRGFLDWPNRPAEPIQDDWPDEKFVYFFAENDTNVVFVWELPFEFYKNRARIYGSVLDLVQDIHLNRADRVLDIQSPPIVIRILSSEVNISFTVEPFSGRGDTRRYSVTISEEGAYLGEDDSQRAIRADVMRALLTANKFLVFTDIANKEFIAIRSVTYDIAVDKDQGMGTYGIRPDWIEVCDCPKEYSGDSCESCAEDSRGPCQDMEPCEDVCNDKGICLGCPQCEFAYTSYHRNINNKTESVFGACESGNPEWLTSYYL